VRRGLLFFLVLAACGGGGSPAPFDAPEIEAAPDVVLLTVSGRRFDPFAPFCPPECNEAYLGEPGDAGEAIFTELATRGLAVDVEHYIAAWESYDGPPRLGCRQLVEDLRWIEENWPEAAIVIVGHSHGCVWAHNVAAALPDVEIDVLVSIDGVSLQWEGDHGDSIEDWFGTAGGNPFPHDLADVTEVWPTAAGTRDTKDVAFANVVFNVEVQSNDLLFSDDVDNVRLDGTDSSIARLAAPGDNHSEVHEPGTESMNFVIDRLVVALLSP